MTGLIVDLVFFRRAMKDIGRNQVPFALAQAINDTAVDVKEAWEREFERALDRPTPFTKRGVYVRRATKSRRVAEVGIKDVQAGYLRLQMTGGTRRPRRRAILMPAGIRLNKYGNIARGAVGRAADRSDTFIASKSSPRTAHLKPGIYRRPKNGTYRKGGRGNKNRGTDRGPQMLVSFRDKARYRKRLRMGPVAERTVRRNFERHFAKRFRAARLTAK